jgi:hypothetical protein
MHPFVELAKKTIEDYVKTGARPKTPKDLPSEMQKRAGVFVSLKKKGELRGCIGTFMPCTQSIYEEIVRNAVCAAREDPRFHPVQPDELDEIDYSVDVLSEPERVESISELDPRKYGVLVVKGKRRGLLLPDLEGVDTVEYQLRIAKSKACIDPWDSDVEIYRFTVDRYK